jgi:polyhydroxybutyrate depolymerase
MLHRFLLFLIVSVGLSGFVMVDSARAQAENVSSSSGCGSSVEFETGATEYELESGGMTRSYLLYVPESFDPAAPTPLVLTFHGFAGWPAQQMENSNWTQVADENGFLVVYPAGTGFPLRWRIGQDFNEENDETDDVAYISDLLDALSDQFCLDLNRIYANGLSNGGGMTYLLACDMADRFAAVGTVSGAYIEPEDGCQPSRPVPMITFHGTDDQIVPYEGLTSRRFNFPRIADWVADWAARNSCDDTPETLPDVGEVSSVEYVNCDDNAKVIFYTVNGGGHAWPGGDTPMPERAVGHTTQDIDASAVMWEFFKAHPLNNASSE